MASEVFHFERYLNIRSAYHPSFSHDGCRLAFLTNITGIPQAWTLDAAGGWPDQLTFGLDRVMRVSCSPTHDRLIYSRDVGGNENAQLFLLDGDGTGERRLTHDDGAMHILGGWSGDGRWIAHSANRRNRARYDVYVMDPGAGEEKLVWQNETPGIVVPSGFAPDGNRLLVLLAHSNMDQDLYELSLADGSVRHLTPHTGDVRYAEPAYDAEGRGLYCLSDFGREFAGVVHLDLESLALTPVEQPEAEVDHLVVSRDGRRLAWAVNLDGAHALTCLDLRTGRRWEPADLPLGVISPQDDAPPVFSPEADSLAFAFSTPRRTLDVWIWEVETGSLRTVTRSSRAGVPECSFVDPELIRYPTFDGRQIPAWYFRSRHAGRRPVVVQVHGGPEGQTQPMFFPILQYLLQCGYSVLSPNVRGSIGYGKTYAHLDDVGKRMDSVADLAYAVEWLHGRPEVDPDRIAIYGGSYGGFMALAALTKYPDLWAAGVDIAGITNFVTFLENTGPYRRSSREAEYGSLDRDRDLLVRISPIHHVDRIRAPLMVIHGANDPRVPLNEAEQIVAAVRGRGVPVEFIVYADEGHGLVRLANKLDAYPKIAAFLDRHLSPAA